ncbi:peroxidase-like [Panulirus ornatus]|uniref:peroxidase-like n=1 Tax=Panulirus ornatus TaxID=150431 RepID=UPI003A8BA890
MASLFLRCIIPLLLLVCGAWADRESECIEVGFARSAGSILHQGYEEAKETLLARWSEEDQVGEEGQDPPMYSGLTPLLKNVTRTGQLLEEASRVIVGMIRKTRVGKRCIGSLLLSGLEKHVIPLINLDKTFAEEMGLVMSFRCLVGSPYPNVDGSCINQESPDLGSVGSKFLRLQPAVSGRDGFSPRESVNADKTLPSARKVAQLVRKYLKKAPVTGIFGDWGHFVQRDTFSIPESPLAQVDCCQNPGAEDCAPIPVEEDDPLHALLPCINFRRSARAQAILGHRESMSLVSTYLDATPVYGATDKVAFQRKTGYFGYLKAPEPVDKTEGSNGAEEEGQKAPKKKEEEVKKKEEDKKNVKCSAPESFKGCFQVAEGEDWVEGLQLLLVLEHNRVADSLAEINPHFDDSLLYNEARRIVIAEYAHVTYGEYMPVLMGQEMVNKHSLNPGAEGHAASFIPEVNPGILTNFALASYRNPAMETEWRAEWGRTNIYDSTHYDSIRNDPYQDLLAMDIQRGRDHGVAGYKVWRKFWDTGKAYDKWADLEDGLPHDLVQDIKTLYQDEIDDVDVQLALLEEPSDGGIIGKTYNFLLADQFARLKTGNRLFWEHESSVLTVEQKEVIKEATLARLLCNNLPLQAVPTKAFLPPSDSNPIVQCSELPPPDMAPWKDVALIEKMKERKEEEGKEKDEGVKEKDEKDKETARHSEL